MLHGRTKPFCLDSRALARLRSRGEFPDRIVRLATAIRPNLGGSRGCQGILCDVLAH
jgi:hypothetical protein